MAVNTPHHLVGRFADIFGEGHYCTGDTPDCDIVAGAVSGCTAKHVPSNRTQSSPVQQQSPVAASKAQLDQKVPGYLYTGCLSDSETSRTLTVKNMTSADMTTDICAEYCTGYPYMGVEFATQ